MGKDRWTNERLGVIHPMWYTNITWWRFNQQYEHSPEASIKRCLVGFTLSPWSLPGKKGLIQIYMFCWEIQLIQSVQRSFRKSPKTESSKKLKLEKTRFFRFLALLLALFPPATTYKTSPTPPQKNTPKLWLQKFHLPKELQCASSEPRKFQPCWLQSLSSWKSSCWPNWKNQQKQRHIGYNQFNFHKEKCCFSKPIISGIYLVELWSRGTQPTIQMQYFHPCQ